MSDTTDRPRIAMDEPGSTPRKPHRKVSFLIFLTCGIWLIGLGLYFALLRPALLPEDPRYIGSSLAQILSALPGSVITKGGSMLTSPQALAKTVAAPGKGILMVDESGGTTSPLVLARYLSFMKVRDF